MLLFFLLRRCFFGRRLAVFLPLFVLLLVPSGDGRDYYLFDLAVQPSDDGHKFSAPFKFLDLLFL